MRQTEEMWTRIEALARGNLSFAIDFSGANFAEVSDRSFVRHTKRMRSTLVTPMIL